MHSPVGHEAGPFEHTLQATPRGAAHWLESVHIGEHDGNE
jgi:hypothetical protein